MYFRNHSFAENTRRKYKNRKRFVKQFSSNSNSIPGDAIWKN